MEMSEGLFNAILEMDAYNRSYVADLQTFPMRSIPKLER